MGRELQKRKRRSSRSAVRQPTSHKAKRVLNPLGNNVIAQNWDKTQTMSQNYRRLGLVARLQAPTGGVEPSLTEKSAASKTKTSAPKDPFKIEPTGVKTVVSEARVERDANGKIVRIIGHKSRPNPLNDPLNALDTDSEDEIRDDGEVWGGIEEEDGKEDTRTEVVKELEADANRPRVRKARTQSGREREWLEGLVARHGEDTRAMARDRVLNPMQQTEADLARRIKKMRGPA